MHAKTVGLTCLMTACLGFWAPAKARADSPISVAKPCANELAALEAESFDAKSMELLAGRDEFQVYHGNPILAPGDPDEWDAGAIGSMSVALVDGVYHMYYEAWGRPDPNVDGVDYATLQIGHAVSLDGVHWRKDPANPVLRKGAANEWDEKGTWDPFVIFEDGRFKLWYGGGIHPACDWGYAESDDGSNFTKHGRISQLNHVEDDHVFHDDGAGRFYMYYWDRQHEPNGLFRAESKNETDFDFAGAVPISIDGDYDHPMNKFTHVVREDGKWYMLYADFVRPGCDESYTRLAVSDDGVKWKSVNRRLFEGHDADVLRVGESLYLAYYGPRGRFDQLDSDVRLAIYHGKLASLVREEDAK